jgi:hypothetical protein
VTSLESVIGMAVRARILGPGWAVNRATGIVTAGPEHFFSPDDFCYVMARAIGERPVPACPLDLLAWVELLDAMEDLATLVPWREVEP